VKNSVVTIPVVLAHRGDSSCFPENTMPAFESAAAMDVDVIETDVHLTTDGEVVIWHDDSLERMTGDSRKICEMEWSEIKVVNAASGFTLDGGKTYPYQDTPLSPVRLKDVLRRFPHVKFNVDLKDKNKKLAERYGEVLAATDGFSRVVTASFHSSVLKHFRKLYPQALTSCTPDEVLKLLVMYHTGLLKLPFRHKMKVLQVPEFSGSIKVLSPGFIKQLHNKGLQVQVWTVNSKEEMKRFIEMGVDGIFTDRPELLMKTLKKGK